MTKFDLHNIYIKQGKAGGKKKRSFQRILCNGYLQRLCSRFFLFFFPSNQNAALHLFFPQNVSFRRRKGQKKSLASLGAIGPCDTRGPQRPSRVTGCDCPYVSSRRVQNYLKPKAKPKKRTEKLVDQKSFKKIG